MGRIRHRVVIATVPMYLDRMSELPASAIPQLLERFRRELPPQLRRLLAGPILSDVNGVNTWFFSTAASSGGWEDDNEVREWQEKFIAIFEQPQMFEEDSSHVCSVLVVQWPASASLGPPGTVRRV